MRQEDPKIHERLTAAQARLESNESKPQAEGESETKRPKLGDPNLRPMEDDLEGDNWVVRGNTVILDASRLPTSHQPIQKQCPEELAAKGKKRRTW